MEHIIKIRLFEHLHREDPSTTRLDVVEWFKSNMNSDGFVEYWIHVGKDLRSVDQWDPLTFLKDYENWASTL